MVKKILLADDDELIVKDLMFSLVQDGYMVESVYNGAECINSLRKKRFDMVILDLMKQTNDGMQVCRSIREFTDVPVIILTARNGEMDKVLGFENGADDYVTKPFNLLEVKARIKAILRRNKAMAGDVEANNEIIKRANVHLDIVGRNVTISGREINLTVKEFDLLKLLIDNPGKVFSRESILNMIWGYEYPEDVRTVDVHIRRLREKIEPAPAQPTYVRTKWGVGYFFSS